MLFEYRCAWWSLGKIIKFFAILVLIISAVGLYFSVIETLDNIAELKEIAEKAKRCLKMTDSVNDTVKMQVCNTRRIYHQSTEVIDEGVASGLTLSLDIFEAVNCSCEIVSCTTLLIAAILKIPKLMKIFLIWSVLINFTTLIQLVLLIVDSISYVDKVILYIELWIIGCFFNLRFFISVFKYKKTMEQSNDTEDLLPTDSDDEADFVVIDLK